MFHAISTALARLTTRVREIRAHRDIELAAVHGWQVYRIAPAPTIAAALTGQAGPLPQDLRRDLASCPPGPLTAGPARDLNAPRSPGPQRPGDLPLQAVPPNGLGISPPVNRFATRLIRPKTFQRRCPE